MKKAAIIGIIIAVAIGIGVVYSISSPVSDDVMEDETITSIEENTELTEPLTISEEETEAVTEPATTGRDLSVELDESISVKTP